MDITVRLEREEDYREVENTIREAFWDVYKPGCDEHLVIHKIREREEFIKELSFVACDEGKIVGSIICSKAKVINKKNKEFQVLSIIEVSVLPSYQNKGVGKKLMKHCMEEAKKRGYEAIVIFGEPWFYHPYGFVNAEAYNIKTELGINMEEFMALELFKGALKDVNGRFFESPVFEVDKDELAQFDQLFVPKEKKISDDDLF